VFRVAIAKEDSRKSSLVKYTNGVWSRAKVSRKPARLALQSVGEAEVFSQCSLLDKAMNAMNIWPHTRNVKAARAADL
jgi:hypothetical protein